jgi:hypothetical protein
VGEEERAGEIVGSRTQSHSTETLVVVVLKKCVIPSPKHD